jgi:hypothetical protein
VDDWAGGTGVQDAVPGAAPTRLDRPGRVGRSVRPGGSGPRNRRDARPERPAGFLQRRAGVLLAAAAGLVLVSATGVVVSQLGGSGSTSSASMSGAASDAAAGSAPAAGPEALAEVRFIASDTEYTSQNLAAQARAQLVSFAGQAQGRTATKTAQSPSGIASVTAGPAQALRDRTRLAECIKGLDRAVAPIAVDFSTYQNREAAIVLLPAPDGGYEVWAVDPTCGPDGDGVLGFSTLPAP